MPEDENDLILGPVVGGVTATGARLWGRTSVPGRLHAWVGVQPDLEDAGLLGISPPLTAETGFAGVVPLGGLDPEVRYYYALTLVDTPPDPATGPFSSFRTLPPPGSTAPFNLAFGSCFLPATRMGGEVFRAIDERREADYLRALLLLGDQIYAEAGDRNGIGKVGVSLDEYRSLYAYSWSRQPFQDLMQNLPAFMIMDDHEVDNDWYWADLAHKEPRINWWDRLIRWFMGRPFEERSLSLQRVGNALRAYEEHQVMHGPTPVVPPSPNGEEVSSLGPYAYEFNIGAAAFFVFDLRTQRVKSGKTRLLLGEAQWQAFESWLEKVKDDFPLKFLVSSSSILFDMWLDISRDRWNGYPEERDRLLQMLGEHAVEGVYILTGDLHSSHAIRAEVRTPGADKSISIWEFCSSPFEQSHSPLIRFTYRAVKSPWLADQELVFLVAQNCFGELLVSYPDGSLPRVGYKVFGVEGDLLAEVG